MKEVGRMNPWLHPLKHNREQRAIAARKNLEAYRHTLERAQGLRAAGRIEEAVQEAICAPIWLQDPGVFYPWERA